VQDELFRFDGTLNTSDARGIGGVQEVVSMCIKCNAVIRGCPVYALDRYSSGPAADRPLGQRYKHDSARPRREDRRDCSPRPGRVGVYYVGSARTDVPREYDRQAQYSATSFPAQHAR